MDRRNYHEAGGMSVVQNLAPERVILPQCDHPMDENQFNSSYQARRAEKASAKGWDLGNCLCHASYRIGGNNYCKKHAQKVALEVLLKQTS